MSEELINKLKKIASQKAKSDNEDFMVDDYAGGNIDEAYYMGIEAGVIKLARNLLNELGIKY